MYTKAIVIIALSTIFSLSHIDPAQAREPGNTISFQFENDFFGGGTDRYFTHGTRLEYISRPLEWMAKAANKVPWFFAEPDAENSGEELWARGSLSIGQNIYTPADITTDQLILNDRPYAGWLYLGFGVVTNRGSQRYDQLKLELGMVGPCTRAKEVQTYWHSLYGLTVPEGWHHQLNNEPGFVLYYEQARRLVEMTLSRGLEMDIIPHLGISLGNVFTHLGCGFTARIGRNLRYDFGPPRIRPSLPGGVVFQRDKKINWYIFAGAGGRLILRDIFLDGNTFSKSHSIKKDLVNGDIQAGLSLQLKRFRLSYTQIFRGREYKNQDTGHVFGSLSLSWQFN